MTPHTGCLPSSVIGPVMRPKCSAIVAQRIQDGICADLSGRPATINREDVSPWSGSQRRSKERALMHRFAQAVTNCFVCWACSRKDQRCTDGCYMEYHKDATGRRCYRGRLSMHNSTRTRTSSGLL